MFSAKQTIAQIASRKNRDMVAAIALYVGKDETTVLAELAAMALQLEQAEAQLAEQASTLDVNSLEQQTLKLQQARAAYEAALAAAQDALSQAKTSAITERQEATHQVVATRQEAKQKGQNARKLRSLARMFAS